MFTTHRGIARRTLAIGLSLAILFPPVSGLATPVLAQGTQPDSASSPMKSDIHSILLFPLTNDAGPAADPLAARVTDAIKLKLNSVGRLKVTAFSKFLPSVQRAVNDAVLSQRAIKGPFTDPQDAGVIASQVNTDGYIIGGIESFSTNPTTKKVSIEVSATLYNTATGVALRSLAYTGEAVPVVASQDQQSVTESAVNDVAAKIASALNSGAPAAPVVVGSSQRGSSKAGSSVLIALLGGALLFAAFHHGGSSSSSTTTNNPPPPVDSGPPPPPVLQ